MNQRHLIVCYCEICIQTGTYQESLNHWFKQQLIYTTNHAKQFTRISVEKFNAENIVSRYSYFVLPDGELVHPRAKYSAFASMCDFPEKDIKIPKWSCVLNWCSEFPGVFVSGA